MTTTKTRARKAPEAEAAPAVEWAYGVRTWQDGEGRSHGDFKWDLTPGARTEAPDWRPRAECGNGLHCNPQGLGDWSLLADDFGQPGGSILGVVRYDPKLAVDLNGKIKAPWMEVVVTTRDASLGAVLGAIQTHCVAEILRQVKDAKGPLAKGLGEHAASTGEGGHAASTGNYGHAASTGEGGHAASTGNYGHAASTGNYGHAASTGEGGHAASTGKGGHAASTGNYGHAASTGYRGHAEAKGKNSIAGAFGAGGRAKAADGGAIMLASYVFDNDGMYALRHVFAGKIGETHGGVTIKPDTWYELSADGVPVEVAE